MNHPTPTCSQRPPPPIKQADDKIKIKPRNFELLGEQKGRHLLFYDLKGG